MGLVAVVLVSVLLGCSGGDPAKPKTNTATEHAHTTTDEDTKMNETMTQLSTEDRAKAEAQKICHESDEPLGSMRMPIKVTVQGRDVFVCCEGCVDELTDNFAKYADKLESKSYCEWLSAAWRPWGRCRRLVFTLLKQVTQFNG
jgi:hypothetical protein